MSFLVGPRTLQHSLHRYKFHLQILTIYSRLIEGYSEISDQNPPKSERKSRKRNELGGEKKKKKKFLYMQELTIYKQFQEVDLYFLCLIYF